MNQKKTQEEQASIAREKELSGEPLSWADTRRMKMTSRVIQETMRVASILSFTFREAVEDVEYQGEQSRDVNSSFALSLSEYSSAQPAHELARKGRVPN